MYEESMIERETIKNLSSSRMEFGKNDRFVLEIKSEERILERLDGLVYRSCVGSMNGERGKISRQRESNAKFRPIEAESNNGRDPLAEGSGAIRTSPVYHAVEIFERRSTATRSGSLRKFG